MKVEVVQDVDRRAWNKILSEDPRSTFFHTLEWGESLERSLIGWERYFLLGTVDGHPVAGLPAMRYSKRGFYAMMSMPFGTYGGPVVGNDAPESADDLLAKRFFEEARSTRVAFAELVDFPPRTGAASPEARGLEDDTQVLDLSSGIDEVLKGFKPANRNKIRKAQKAGVTVRRGRRKDDFRWYHRVLLDCSKAWGGRVRFDRKFFEGLSAIETGSVQLWLAEYEGSVVAGLMNFAHNDNVMNWGAVTMRDARHLSPMNLLHSDAVKAAVEDGLRTYNFGSSAGFKGVEEFKTSFGTTRVGYRHYLMQKRWFAVAKRWSKRRRR
jgi:CelD/BcsL family acetyltransferase involved in cellulose biosynthesis